MGLFERILGGGGGGSPPPWIPGDSPFRGDDSAGQTVTTAEIAQGPFPKQMRLRGSYADYALIGSWQVVSLNSPADWEAAKDQVFQAYYKQFGLYRLPDGNSTIRWNETTWREIRDQLQVLYDPKFRGGGAAAPSPV